MYELVTRDKDDFPLPSLRFLDAQFALHKIMAGIKAAGELAEIFGGGDPPDDYDEDDPVPTDTEPPYY